MPKKSVSSPHKKTTKTSQKPPQSLKKTAKAQQATRNAGGGFSKLDALHLFLSIVVAQLAGALGALFTTTEINSWYIYLRLPAFAPPNWVFGPVWTFLYLLMGIALFLTCRYGKPAKQATTASYWFYAQLVVNVLWSVVFFGFKDLWERCR